MELGRVGFKRRDVSDLLSLYGVSDEESASRLQTYEIYFVPGLLQTARYARAVFGAGLPECSDEEIDRRTSLRLRRQQMFTLRGNARLWAVIDESIPHRPIGGRAVLREQLEHLLEITTLPNISLQVVPFALGGSAGEGSFTILRFAESDLPDIVYLEHLRGALYLDKGDEVEQYTKVANRLGVDARTPEDIGNSRPSSSSRCDKHPLKQQKHVLFRRSTEPRDRVHVHLHVYSDVRAPVLWSATRATGSPFDQLPGPVWGGGFVDEQHR